ncbi:unnamed protein product [Rangifer tarandus platyrhynchus]|uniref:Uncharacterized protein n=1 Tax=Rangifer tarandus platyrhynchus TaxID=3082113 RepID=A0AC59ZFC6_RANTA
MGWRGTYRIAPAGPSRVRGTPRLAARVWDEEQGGAGLRDCGAFCTLANPERPSGPSPDAPLKSCTPHTSTLGSGRSRTATTCPEPFSFPARVWLPPQPQPQQRSVSGRGPVRC